MDAGSGHLPPNAAFRAARLRLQLSQDELVRALREAGWPGCDRRAVQRYEQGVVTRPQFAARRALAAVFGVPMSDLGLALPTDNMQDGDDVNRRQMLRMTGTQPLSGAGVDRRSVLQSMAIAGIAASPGLEGLRSLQADLERLVNDGSSSLDEWRQTVVEYGYSYASRPAQELLPDVASDLLAVRSAMEKAGAEHYPEWCQVVAGLSLVLAKTLSNLDQAHEARTWWQTAQHAADASMDPDLSLRITGERLVRGIYEGQPLGPLLARSADSMKRRDLTPGLGAAQISAAHAQLLSMAGRGADAEHELARSWAILDGMPASVSTDPASSAAWGPNRLDYTEAWVYAHLGDRPKVDRAVARSRAALPAEQPRVHTQLRLLQASGHVSAGDVSGGLDEARAALEELPAEMHTLMITSMGTMTLGAVPADQTGRPEVANYRELLGALGNSTT